MDKPQIAEVRSLSEHVGDVVRILGWVETTRVHGKIGFAVVRDGTGIVQTVWVKNEIEAAVWEQLAALTQETSVWLDGVVREEARSPGGFEIGVQAVGVIGTSAEYPIQPKEHGVDFLLDHRHLWLRSSQQRALLRVRAEVEQGILDFLYERDFIRIDTPILTGSIGESAGTLFETEYFGERAFLAQTGQLYVETACPAFRRVFCFGPTFRAEKSKTRRHLTEFWMVEPEVAFADSNDNMDLQEDLVSYLVARVLERRADSLEILERDTSSLEKVKRPFPRVSYTEAVELLQAAGSGVEWGQDIGGADETTLAANFEVPVCVYNYPKGAKAFYMKENPEDPRTVLCNDMIAPEGYGEIIGGSQREDDLDKLLARIREEQLPEDAYSWYLDLRRYGTFPHSGFGLGLERFVAWVTGRPHIRELIPYPRMMNRLSP